MENPAFANLITHLNSEGHKQAHIIYHKTKTVLPQNFLLPQSNKGR